MTEGTESPLVIQFPEQRSERTSAAIDAMQAARLKPRAIAGRLLTPPDIHYDYVQRWQAEGKVLAQVEVLEAERKPPPAPVGRLRRAWRALFGAAA